MEEKAWYNSPTNRFLSLRMAVPYSQIVIGSSPVKGMTLGTAQQFDAFINLTEDPLYSKSLEKPREKIRYYWIPINKIGAWEYLPFYKSKQIIRSGKVINKLKEFILATGGDLKKIDAFL